MLKFNTHTVHNEQIWAVNISISKQIAYALANTKFCLRYSWACSSLHLPTVLLHTCNPFIQVSNTSGSEEAQWLWAPPASSPWTINQDSDRGSPLASAMRAHQNWMPWDFPNSLPHLLVGLWLSLDVWVTYEIQSLALAPKCRPSEDEPPRSSTPVSFERKGPGGPVTLSQ